MNKMSAHAHEPRACATTDLFRVRQEGELNPDEVKLIEQIDAYLGVFAAPITVGEGEQAKQVCFHCGEKFTGLLANLGVGVGIKWGLAHGEGICSGCGWPYRGHHFAKAPDGEDLFSAQNLFLAYMPAAVTEAQPEKAA